MWTIKTKSWIFVDNSTHGSIVVFTDKNIPSIIFWELFTPDIPVNQFLDCSKILDSGLESSSRIWLFPRETNRKASFGENLTDISIFVSILFWLFVKTERLALRPDSFFESRPFGAVQYYYDIFDSRPNVPVNVNDGRHIAQGEAVLLISTAFEIWIFSSFSGEILLLCTDVLPEKTFDSSTLIFALLSPIIDSELLTENGDWWLRLRSSSQCSFLLISDTRGSAWTQPRRIIRIRNHSLIPRSVSDRCTFRNWRQPFDSNPVPGSFTLVAAVIDVGNPSESVSSRNSRQLSHEPDFTTVSSVLLVPRWWGNFYSWSLFSGSDLRIILSSSFIFSKVLFPFRRVRALSTHCPLPFIEVHGSHKIARAFERHSERERP